MKIIKGNCLKYEGYPPNRQFKPVKQPVINWTNLLKLSECSFTCDSHTEFVQKAFTCTVSLHDTFTHMALLFMCMLHYVLIL